MARAKVNQDINLDEYQDIWVIGEQREGKLHPVTLELIGEGSKTTPLSRRWHLLSEASAVKAFLHGGICEGYLGCDSSAKAGDRACWGH